MTRGSFSASGVGQAQQAEEASRAVTRRAAVVTGFTALIGMALALRIRQLQVVETERYRLLAEENRINLRLIAPVRAEIFDRNGMPLAINTQNYRVVIVREQTNSVDQTLDDLGRLIPIAPRQRERVVRDLRSKAAFVPVSVAEHLSWQEFSRINANTPALPGIQPEVGVSRHYPHGELTAHVVGYVGRVTKRDIEALEEVDPVLQIPEFQIGKNGIEKAVEGDLRGEAGSRHIEVNARGRVVRELDRQEGISGSDLHLTLDLDLQAAVQRRLGSESAAAVLIDLREGDLLALASSPSYDPNPFVQGISQSAYATLLNDDHRPLHNKWASGMYPPGSTFKMIVALAALEAGVIGPEETVYCPGHMTLGNRRFHCWKRGGHGSVNLRQSIEQSCDVYYYEVAKRTGIEKIAEMARRFSLGVEIGLPVTSVKSGLIPTKDWKQRTKDEPWQKGDSLNAGIGQGFVLTTPLQLAVMTARLATGRALAPRLIKARAGLPLSASPVVDLDVDPDHLKLVRQGMYDVVNGKRGTARRSRISDPENRMAGKTGTSQVRNITAAERAEGVWKNEDLPWRRRDHALFVGYAPYDNPRYAVSVIVEHGGGGSKAAAPIARDILLRAIYGPYP
ncbi:MAG: penicillin-binding protein 2, partial [Pseudomonadota bacterium]